MALSRRWIVLTAVLVALLAAGVALYLIFRPARNGQPEPRLAKDEVRQLIHSKNVGLGLLENQKVAESIPIFDEIARTLADEPLGPRNLAVSRVVALGDDGVQSTPETLAAAQRAVDRVRQVEGETPAYHWLAARVAIAAKDAPRADRHLAEVIRAREQDAAAWYARYTVRRNAPDAALRAAAGAALTRAYELRTGNLWIVVEWFRWVFEQLNDQLAAIRRLPEAEQEAARQQLTERFDDLAEEIEQARPAIRPFAHALLTYSRVDVLKLLDEAVAAAREEQYDVAAARLFALANVLAPQSSLDQQAVRRHPLEFVLDRFRPQFYDRYDISETESVPAIDVSFNAAADFQLPDGLQQELSGIRQVVVTDFNVDGRPDLFVLDADAVTVFGRAAGADEWTQLAAAEVPAGMTGLLVQDMDLDFDETTVAARAGANGCPSADVDVVVYGPPGVRLLENRFDAETQQRTLVPRNPVSEGNRVSENVGREGEAPIEPQQPARAEEQRRLGGSLALPQVTGIRAATAADLDADGDLDLVLAAEPGLSLWSNNGNWTFTDISSRSSLPKDFRANALLPLDFDRDVDIDVIAAGETSGGGLENLRHGQFRWREFDDAFAAAKSAAALEIVDADSNASWDLFAAGAKGITLVRTATPEAGVVRALGSADVADFAATGLETWDYDNDGLLDIVAWNADALTIRRGLPGGRFGERLTFGYRPEELTDVTTGDIDGDGDLDLAIALPDRLALHRNEGGNANHWIDVALQAQQIKGQQHSPSGRVNPHGIGSLLELKAGVRYQPRVVRDQVTHFGLGRQEAADVVRVVWLNGVPQNIIRPAADLFLCEQQILNTSCPYLYTWNGEEFVFATDLLWAAPLGLQFAEGVLAPAREWEYIKVPGEILQPKDGEYVVQITEELWEATYFDEVKLIAVDHPADVEIYSNEKVGPAAIAAFKVHTVRHPRPPVAARNHRGRDLLPEIARRDDVYLKAFERKLRQGLVEEHYLELDLGDFDRPERITLFLTGWVYPAATSINVALSQNPAMPLPQPPSLQVPDGRGGWKDALPYMGFPGGKTKTIAVDLSGLFDSDDYRVRMATSMELYWDQIVFTVDEPPAETRLQELTLKTADLHERGYSRIIHDAGYGPEHFPYDHPTTAPKWPPMAGRFTRLGDVTELLTARDDRLLVLGAGDEVTLRFTPPQDELPPGWTRDFLLYSVGWDKDCNLNTVLGQTVGPLPFRAMSRYPFPADERPPDSPAYRDYLRQYQTRTQSPDFWHVIRDFGTRRDFFVPLSSRE